MIVHRGEIYYADLSPVVGSEQGGVRPVLIVQNDVGNKFSPTVIAAAITSQKDKANLPTHIAVNAQGSGLIKDSIILLEQVRTLDKHRLRKKWAAWTRNPWAGWTRPFPSALACGLHKVGRAAPWGMPRGVSFYRPRFSRRLASSPSASGVLAASPRWTASSRRRSSLPPWAARWRTFWAACSDPPITDTAPALV